MPITSRIGLLLLLLSSALAVGHTLNLLRRRVIIPLQKSILLSIGFGLMGFAELLYSATSKPWSGWSYVGVAGGVLFLLTGVFYQRARRYEAPSSQ